MSDIGDKYSMLLDRLQVLYTNENLGYDCINTLNFIAGLMCELDGGIQNATLTSTMHIDKLKIFTSYGDTYKIKE